VPLELPLIPTTKVIKFENLSPKQAKVFYPDRLRPKLSNFKKFPSTKDLNSEKESSNQIFMLNAFRSL
jgi:hypothetical protein